MILICGIPSESPLAMVHEQLVALGVPVVLFNQRNFSRMDFSFELRGTTVSGLLKIDGSEYRLEDFTGVYARLMDERLLPEFKSEAEWSPLRSQCHGLHNALIQWCEIAPARVVNRVAPMSTNASKPYQAQLISRQGFAVPDTLITNDPELVREFQRDRPVIYKSISSVRSIVQALRAEDLARLDRIRWCPTQFQELIQGTNVRVHVVGAECFATAITSETTDYRYAYKTGKHTELREVDLDGGLAEKCVHLARALNLPFAGIDLIITPDEQAYCLEVNPSPGFSYYERHTGQPVARALARYLAGMA
ncbi:MAG: ATP-grasp domain-containing protein [Syntrophobacter sp.]